MRSEHDDRGNTATEVLASKMISGEGDSERVARALGDFSDDQWVNEFIKRLNYLVEDIVHKK